MSLNSEKLISIRQEITEHKKRIVELENEQDEFWKRIIRDFNSNKAMYRKVEGLNGLLQAKPYDTNNPYLVVVFDKNSNVPSAKGLSFIEEDTGLLFKGCVSENEFRFGL